jgi:hypothetical protein
MSLTHFLLWSARILGIATSLFLGLFALDAFTAGRSFDRALVDFAIHLLPAIVVLVIVVMAWERPWAGGLAFIAIAAAYGLTARSRPDWILAVSGPLLAVGVLFLWSWRSQQRHKAI